MGVKYEDTIYSSRGRTLKPQKTTQIKELFLYVFLLHGIIINPSGLLLGLYLEENKHSLLLLTKSVFSKCFLFNEASL